MSHFIEGTLFGYIHLHLHTLNSRKSYRRTVTHGEIQGICVLTLVGSLRLKAELLSKSTLTERRKPGDWDVLTNQGLYLVRRKDNVSQLF